VPGQCLCRGSERSRAPRRGHGRARAGGALAPSLWRRWRN